MKFEITYNDINFILELAQEKNFVPSNRFQKLSKNAIWQINQNQIAPYSLIIECTHQENKQTFYFSSVILSTNEKEIMDDLQQYLIDEDILELIEEHFKRNFNGNNYPYWKK